MEMPFGKYRGRELPDVPDSYLYWLMTIDLREPLRLAVERELDRREGHVSYSGSSIEVPPELLPHIKEIINKGFQNLCMQHHPDRGGNPDTMRMVYEARRWMRNVLSLE
jgi:hypothetical protein